MYLPSSGLTKEIIFHWTAYHFCPSAIYPFVGHYVHILAVRIMSRTEAQMISPAYCTIICWVLSMLHHKGKHQLLGALIPKLN
uniref:Uncharacterized protein n=1 Tax=Arion vulgaris TaxID=1028688 RepID=A0A0B6ZSJ1_9EUPU